jgi:isopenicillin-N N-acyltransferase-like protein
MKEFPSTHILTLSGQPRQRGRIHGESLRQEIREVLDRWKNLLEQRNKTSPDQFIRQFLGRTNFVPAIERWTPDLQEETKGIAEGANVDFTEIFAFQLQDEYWWFEQEEQPTQNNPHRCSSIGWRGQAGRPGLVAQNMDLHMFLDGYQVVLRILENDSDRECLVFSAAGLLALNGMNRSLGIVCNNLGQLNHSREGLPVAHVLRGVLEQDTLAEAISFLKNIRHASGQNYMLCDQSQITDQECSANQVMEYSPGERAWNSCHTNHPFTNSDFRDEFKDLTPEGQDLWEFSKNNDVNSCTRFEVLTAQLGGLDAEQADVEAAARLLRSHDSDSHPVCRHPETNQGWMTVGTSIMTFGDSARLTVCPGPPCSSLFSEFSFSLEPVRKL